MEYIFSISSRNSLQAILLFTRVSSIMFLFLRRNTFHTDIFQNSIALNFADANQKDQSLFET